MGGRIFISFCDDDFGSFFSRSVPSHVINVINMVFLGLISYMGLNSKEAGL
jgi:hypothetical protein